MPFLPPSFSFSVSPRVRATPSRLSPVAFPVGVIPLNGVYTQLIDNKWENRNIYGFDKSGANSQ